MRDPDSEDAKLEDEPGSINDDDAEEVGLYEEDARTEAVEEMKEWFLDRYEDPAHRTPYESAEGGYIWIWGGPYDAREELESEFHDRYPGSWIEEAAGDLELDCVEWAPVPSEDDYDSTLFHVISANTEPYETLSQSLAVVEGLLRQELPATLAEPLLRLLYANCITIVETYLSDSFINRVLGDDTLLQRFLDTTPDLAKQSVPLKDVIKEATNIRERVKRYLLDVVWHNLAKVQAMYRDTLRINFEATIAEVARAIPQRHDIVHRNGRAKAGGEVSINASDVHQLAVAVRTLALAVDEQLRATEGFALGPGIDATDLDADLPF